MSTSSSVLAQIARPYANALFDLAKEANNVAEIESGLDGLSALIDGNEDFANFLRSPVIDSEEKAGAMNAILAKANPGDLVGNFVKTIAANGRLFALPNMISAFKELAATDRGELRADVTSASKLSAAQVKSLADTLKKKFGKDISLDTHIDPELIGGLVVKVGSRMIDTSLKTKLTAMKIAMKEVG